MEDLKLKDGMRIEKISTIYYVIEKNNDVYGCYKSIRSLKKAMNQGNYIKQPSHRFTESLRGLVDFWDK
jgi:hypothetical protein